MGRRDLYMFILDDAVLTSMVNSDDKWNASSNHLVDSHQDRFLGLDLLRVLLLLLLLRLNDRGPVIEPQAEEAGHRLVDVLVPVLQRLPEVLHNIDDELPDEFTSTLVIQQTQINLLMI